jgi:dTDP-4-dehydrorhamnose reductase
VISLDSQPMQMILQEAIMEIIDSEKDFGIYHFSNYPETTWFDFASKIKEFSDSHVQLKAITTEEFPTPAKRPKRSTMSLDKIENDYHIEPKTLGKQSSRLHRNIKINECVNYYF